MRVAGWESLLADHIRTAYATPFAWGTHDCALWCADWVLKATGADLTGGLRGTYSTGIEATEALAAMGLSSVADLAARHLPEIPLGFASRGDVVLHPQGALGICEGVYSHFPMIDGATRFPTGQCVKAWRVG